MDAQEVSCLLNGEHRWQHMKSLMVHDLLGLKVEYESVVIPVFSFGKDNAIFKLFCNFFFYFNVLVCRDEWCFIREREREGMTVLQGRGGALAMAVGDTRCWGDCNRHEGACRVTINAVGWGKSRTAFDH